LDEYFSTFFNIFQHFSISTNILLSLFGKEEERATGLRSVYLQGLQTLEAFM